MGWFLEEKWALTSNNPPVSNTYPDRKVVTVCGNRLILSDNHTTKYLTWTIKNTLPSFTVAQFSINCNNSRLHHRFFFSCPPNFVIFLTMPALDPRIIRGIREASVILQRDAVPKHEIIEAFLVSKLSSSPNWSSFSSIPWTYHEIVFVSIFGVGGAIWWAIAKCKG